MKILNSILDAVKKHASDVTTKKAVGIGSVIIGFCGIVGWFALPVLAYCIILTGCGLVALDE